jgi:mannose-6-phosphate isomerase-like protein (cupin superfamily)
MTKQKWRAILSLASIAAIAGCSHQPAPSTAASATGRNVDHVTVIHLKEQPAQPYPWGEIHWLMSNKLDPDANQTFGIVRINAGQKNALHLHPNCEELLYVLSGDGESVVGDKKVPLHPGDLLRVPAGVYHQATVTSTEPMVAVISYSSGDRQVINKGPQSE